MDAEDLAKAALSAIDDWLDEEIVGFEPEEDQNEKIPGFITPEMTSMINKNPILTAQFI